MGGEQAFISLDGGRTAVRGGSVARRHRRSESFSCPLEAGQAMGMALRPTASGRLPRIQAMDLAGCGKRQMGRRSTRMNADKLLVFNRRSSAAGSFHVFFRILLVQDVLLFKSITTSLSRTYPFIYGLAITI